MKLVSLHNWRVSPQEAMAIQKELRQRVTAQDNLGAINLVAGVDVGYENSGRTTRAAIVVLEFPSLSVREVATVRRKTTFPYVPGLLSFRELPALLEAMEKLKTCPDMVLCDGQGFAHPRRFGIACHLGVVTGIPAIGIGKSRLLGKHNPVPNLRGHWRPLIDNDECIGAVLRTRVNVKPIYVSIGHRISLPTAIAYVLRCTPRYRLPETTRLAHRYASGS